MGADGWPAADVARPVTDACERANPPMESISAAWQGLTLTDSPGLKQKCDMGREFRREKLLCAERMCAADRLYELHADSAGVES
ncbi:hypothetical protein NQZ68_003047 [Dissostichus eleginoides]|nr:hypothetical protein NQZ68_003047 [Dissostichus eleginoides]